MRRCRTGPVLKSRCEYFKEGHASGMSATRLEALLRGTHLLVVTGLYALLISLCDSDRHRATAVADSGSWHQDDAGLWIAAIANQ